jgi:hypothetical protein
VTTIAFGSSSAIFPSWLSEYQFKMSKKQMEIFRKNHGNHYAVKVRVFPQFEQIVSTPSSSRAMEQFYTHKSTEKK